MVFPANHLTGTSKTEPNFNQVVKNILQTEHNELKTSHAIQTGNGAGPFYSTQEMRIM